MSELIFWCRMVLSKKDRVAPKLLVHFSLSRWEISVPQLTTNYGWRWCVIVWLLTGKLRVKWIKCFKPISIKRTNKLGWAETQSRPRQLDRDISEHNLHALFFIRINIFQSSLKPILIFWRFQPQNILKLFLKF